MYRMLPTGNHKLVSPKIHHNSCKLVGAEAAIISDPKGVLLTKLRTVEMDKNEALRGQLTQTHRVKSLF
jgi:hypothetical protein